VVEADVTGVTGMDLRLRARVADGQQLLVVGGAPCQAFSKAAYWLEDGKEAQYRRARARGEGVMRHGPLPPRTEDKRRDLVAEFIRLVIECEADGFLFENVPSILHPRNRHHFDGLVAAASAAGYACRVVRANALDYGVAQGRHRVFVLGSRRSLPEAPAPSHSAVGDAYGLLPYVSAGQALEDVTWRSLPEPAEAVAGKWADHLRAIPPGSNYKFHSAWAGHPEPTFVAETRFWNFLLKLAPERPSWTIAANPGPWTGPFHWESRRLRVPELAALQGFPATYQFAGDRRAQVRQIGNAVPPPMARRMIEALLEAMRASREAAA